MIECPECCLVEVGEVISRTESRSAFIIKNKHRRRIQICHVDGCLIPGTKSKKCDFLFFLNIDRPDKIILVEFKGIDHVAALEQLVSTAEQLNLKRYGVPVESLIVGSPAPKIQTKFQKEMLKIAGRYQRAGVSLPQKKSNSHTITLG